MLTQTPSDVGEHTIISRAGGAPTLAVGMAHILHSVIGGKAMMAFWYHFAILFEALFILTAVDAGTACGRFMLQDLLGTLSPLPRHRLAGRPTCRPPPCASRPGATSCIRAWSIRLGGINTLWPLFGIANQMLAAIALMLCTVVLFKMKRERYAWVTMLPTAVWLLICTLTAGWQKDRLGADHDRFRHRRHPAGTGHPRSDGARDPRTGTGNGGGVTDMIKDATLTLSAVGKGLIRTARLMVGVPDYETYVAHRKAVHPGEPVMSFEEFFRERQQSRYGATGGKISRCC
jgi:uncharacterized short protein YbdD (DUF466 family)